MIDPSNSQCRYSKLKNGHKNRRFNFNDENLKNKQTFKYNNEIKSHGSYGALLFKPEWRSKRKEILFRDNHSCVICKSNSNLQVHHRQYHFTIKENQFKLPWQYPENLLVTLCESCHNKGHQKFKVPTIYI
jgi:5-methylcytosine-specific restriction endonuclease McrA